MNRVVKGIFYLIGLIVVGLLCFYGGKIQKIRTTTRVAPMISIYDEEELLKISLEDVGKYHGDICPCLVTGFMATQLAISQLWRDEIPKRGDFKIISACPTEGTKDAFEFITRAKTRGDFTLKLPEGTDIASMTKNNWTFTFIRKTTGEQIEIRVKEEVFSPSSEEFFKIRKKVKFEGTATLKEKENFKMVKQEIKQKLENWQDNKLFGFERK